MDAVSRETGMRRFQRSLRNCCRVSPVSVTIPPTVRALTGACLGMVRIRAAVGHDDVLAQRGDLGPGFLERLDSSQMGDPGIFGSGYAGTSTPLRFCGPANCLATAKYSRIAS